MYVSAVCYGLGFLAFLTLLALMLLRHRPSGFGLWFVGVYTITALWALSAALPFPWLPGISHVLDGLHSAAWVELIALVFVEASVADKTEVNKFYTRILPIVCIIVAVNDLRFVSDTAGMLAYEPSQVFCRIAISICGLLMVENLFRNTLPARRWFITPLCIGAGALFAYDLFVFAQAVVVRHADATLLAGRGIVLALVLPPLIVTMVRNQSWNIDIHISRRVVFHTATLTAGGIFLILAAGIAGFIGELSGEWGAILKLTFLAGSVLAVIAALSVASLRSRLWRTLFENFFSARYDYRAEWMRCIDTLSSSSDRDPLQIRVIRAVSDVVDSPGGILWLKDADGIFRVSNTMNMGVDTSAIERETGAFVEAFAGGAVYTFDIAAASSPDWLKSTNNPWLAVPLLLSEEIVGFIVLAQPRAPLTLSQESSDLLIAVGRQGASWLLEDLSARRLAESRALIEYGKKFSFVAHDVKNVSSQLGIMIANMKNFGDQPEFRADMVRTMEASIARLNDLIAKLRGTEQAAPPRTVTDVGAVLKGVAVNFDPGAVIVDQDGRVPDCESISESDLRSVLTHVITNAIEASKPSEPVAVSLQANDVLTIITVRDKGCGMSPAFVNDELFTPMRSTKRDGHGIGAYQSRELVRSAGGSFEVKSTVGEGTMIRIVLPRKAATSDLRIAPGKFAR